LTVEPEFDAQRRNEKNAATVWARFTGTDWVVLHPMIRLVGGDGDRFAKCGVGSRPEVGQFIDRRLKPFDPEYQSFSK